MAEDKTTAQDVNDGAIAPEDIVEEGELTDEEIVSRTVLYAFEEAGEKLEQSGGFDPFTIVISGEELYIEEQPGETEEESYASARRTVFQMERLCDAYVFCYDGYVDLDDGTSDAIVVEWARKGDGEAQAFVKLYHLHDGHYHFEEELYQVGEAESLFSTRDGATISDSLGVGQGDGALVPPSTPPAADEADPEA